MNFITGEKLQEFTEHTLVLKGQYHVDAQLKNTNCKYTYFEPNQIITTLPEEILQAKSLFVYTHILDFFFEKIYPLLKQPFVLVTHNSDYSITDKYKQYLDGNLITKWFAQNVEYIHSKLVPLPIGIANSQWPHGNLEIIQTVINENHRKVVPVYKNFDCGTCLHSRTSVNESTTKNGILMAPKKPYIEYLRDVAKSYFTICPRGNGLDTHRVWESLYLQTIPVIDDSYHFQTFHLPMVGVIDQAWNQITINKLHEIYTQKFLGQDLYTQPIDLEYWKKRIQEGV